MTPKQREGYETARRKIERWRAEQRDDELSLDDLNLVKLPPEIGQLTTLKGLSLRNNELTCLPPEIGRLKSLVGFSVRNNQLRTLPPEIGQLRALVHLSARNNKLESLPPEIGSLAALEWLILRNNQLSLLPAEIGRLRSLRALSVENNHLRNLPHEMARLKNLRELYLHDNPDLSIPDSTLGPPRKEIGESPDDRPASPRNILKHYFALKRGAQPLNEVKLVVIGRGGAGKTSLVRTLMGQPFKESEIETAGIGISTWSLECKGAMIKVHIWDFAGQEITHEAHRFFLTERCIYLIVTEGRQNLQDADAEHWLAHVKQFGTSRGRGERQETSPALVIANKVDLAKCQLERTRLEREYPFVWKFLETDCRTGRGIAALKSTIVELIGSKEMENVRQPFPTQWRKLKERMHDWKSLNRHFFDEKEFAKECDNQGVAHGDRLTVTNVLNQLGIALYYGTNPRLRDTRVLDPHWLANGMYALIRGVEKHGDEHPGELREDEIEKRLLQGLELMDGSLTIEAFPKSAQKFLVELMEDRELCFAARETEDGVPIYLLPGLLPNDEPAGLNLEAMLRPGNERARLRFTYEILPDGLLPRFIARTHSLSQEQPRWRRGVILEWRGAEESAPAIAIVLADLKRKRVEISVRGGTGKLRQELIGMVRTHLKNIHAEMPKALKAKEELELSPKGEQWTGVELLELAARHQQKVPVEVGGKLEQLSPDDELTTVEPPSAWAEGAEKNALRVFISYSHMDHKHVKRLTTTYLAVLKNEKLIQPWTDGQIRAGEDWDNCIRNEMNSADIIILLLSEDFFASNYIQGKECTEAQERMQRGEAKILPVLLGGKTWEQHEWLAKLQLIPRHKGNLKPLLDFKPRQAVGWEVVQAELRQMIDQIRAQRSLLQKKAADVTLSDTYDTQVPSPERTPITTPGFMKEPEVRSSRV